MIHHYASTKTDKIIFKVVIIPNAGKGPKRLDLSYIASGNIKGYNYWYNGKIVWYSIKLKMHLP